MDILVSELGKFAKNKPATGLQSPVFSPQSPVSGLPYSQTPSLQYSKSQTRFEITHSHPHSKFFFLSPSESSFSGEETVVLQSLKGDFYLGKLFSRKEEAFHSFQNGKKAVHIESKGTYVLHPVSKRAFLDRHTCILLKRKGAKAHFFDIRNRESPERLPVLLAIARAYARLHEKGEVSGSFDLSHIAVFKNGTYHAEFTDQRKRGKAEGNLLPDFLYALSHLSLEEIASKEELSQMLCEYLSNPQAANLAEEYASAHSCKPSKEEKPYRDQPSEEIPTVQEFLLQKALRFSSYAELIRHEKAQSRKKGKAFAVN